MQKNMYDKEAGKIKTHRKWSLPYCEKTTSMVTATLEFLK